MNEVFSGENEPNRNHHHPLSNDGENPSENEPSATNTENPTSPEPSKIPQPPRPREDRSG